jgi:hypothetical protein
MKTAKFVNIFYSLATSHINDSWVSEANKLADIVIDLYHELQPNDSVVTSFDDLEVHVYKSRNFEASYGRNSILFKFPDGLRDESIRQTVVHEYTHHKQFVDKSSAKRQTLIYKQINDIAEGSYMEEDDLLEDAIMLGDSYKLLFPDEEQYIEALEKMKEAAQSGSVEETKRCAKVVFYLTHSNVPIEVEAIRHEAYSRMVSHLKDVGRIKKNVNRFNVETKEEYFKHVLRNVGDQLFQSLFSKNRKKVIKALWYAFQQYKSNLEICGLR